ncbi:MAG: Lrp/AsnC family transcriptional regulator [Candidatus Micrarchaeota archaeon]
METNEDIAILSELEKGDKLEDIAKRHKIATATIRNHIKRLEDAGIIVDEKYRLRYKLLGMQQIILGLDVKPENLLEVIKKLKALKSVDELYRTSGDHVLIANMIGKGDELAEELERIKKIEGVNKIYPAFVEEIEK